MLQHGQEVCNGGQCACQQNDRRDQKSSWSQSHWVARTFVREIESELEPIDAADLL